MKKVVLVLASFMLFICNVKAYPGVSTNHIYYYNLTEDKMFYEENAEDEVDIASLTKITSAIVAIEHIDNLDEEFILTGDDLYGTSGLSVAGFKPGDKVTYRDLLYGLLLPSGAECAKALSTTAFKNTEDMVAAMNELATKLKLEHTHYTNTIGIDDDEHYSSAKDIATVLQYALKNPTFYEIFTSRTYEASNGLLLKSTLQSTNEKLELDLDYILGSKSGFTYAAGRCLASLATHNDEQYILVITNSNANSDISHIVDADKLYQDFFNNYSYRAVIAKDDVITTVKTYNDKDVNFIAKKDYKYFLKNGTNIKIVYDGEKILHKDLKVGDKVGKFTILADGEELITEDLFLEESITPKPPIILITIFIIFVALFLIREFNIYRRKLRRRRKIKRA